MHFQGQSVKTHRKIVTVNVSVLKPVAVNLNRNNPSWEFTNF
jgi:hypothetical protein